MLRGFDAPCALLPAFAVAALLAGCSDKRSGSAGGPPDPNPAPPVGGEYEARVVDSAGLFAAGFGAVRFEARDGNMLDALTYRGSRFDPASGPIWFVMHGASRDAPRYVDTAAPAAERSAALAIVIHFPRTLYPSGSDYTLGVTTSGPADGTALDEGRWREPGFYLYAEVEHLFAAVRRLLGGNQPGYYLFGHSAGSQFTHRLLTFLPAPRLLGGVAANAGWYTLPVDGPEPEFTMPYGLHGSPVREQDLGRLFAAPLSLLLGERDTRTPSEDPLLRGTPEAMAQGDTRLARGQFYMLSARDKAAAYALPFGWRSAVVPRAAHSAAQVIDSAAWFLFSGGGVACTADRAAAGQGLFVSEILADPPDGSGGDANGDGLRDPADDEFVEIVNTGSAAVCLAGWALGDAEDRERHVFPLGSVLEAGDALVVFGGGVPQADFGNAATLTAQFSGRLNLNNDGDVLTLRDARDAVVTEVSWGDCDGVACATDHFPGTLEIGVSLTRVPGPDPQWRRHDAAGNAPFSPGRRPDGTDW